MLNVRMNVKSLSTALVLLAGSSLAFAKVPPVLDRVPENAVIVATVGNIASFEKKLEKWSDAMGFVEDTIALGGENPLEQLRAVTGLQGLNREGSAAFFALKKPADEIAKLKAEADKAIQDGAKAVDELNPDGDDEAFDDEPSSADKFNQTMDTFVLVPVTDYAAFVKSAGGAEPAGAGITQLSIQDEPSFIKNLGNGYALISEHKAPLERFTNVEGKLKAHTDALGLVGAEVSSTSDVLLIANVPQLREDIEKGLKEAEEAAGKQTMPGMEQLGAIMDMGRMLGQNFARDASVGIVGVGLSDAGVWLDVASQFKAGSELAGMFAEKGDTQRVVSRLPQQEFLLVTAMDTSSPQIKKMLTEYTAMSAKMMAAGAEGNAQQADMAKAMEKLMGPFTDMTKYVEQTDGYGMMMGATPGGLMGGLFVNTTAYIETKDAPKYVASFKDGFEKMDGQKLGGISLKSSYKADADTFSDVKVAKWGMQMTADGNDPEAQQLAMMQGFIFGPRGLGGYVASTDKGVVVSYSDNKLLMTNAIEVAKSAKGLSTDADVLAAQSVLPANRTLEAHIGVKTILETVQGFMGMMGGPSDFEVPEKLSPISMGATTHSGGVNMRIYVPNDVVVALRDLTKSMEGMQNQMMDEEPMDDGSPDF